MSSQGMGAVWHYDESGVMNSMNRFALIISYLLRIRVIAVVNPFTIINLRSSMDNSCCSDVYHAKILSGLELALIEENKYGDN